MRIVGTAKRLALFLLCALLLAVSSVASAQDGYEGMYAYTFDYWGDEVYSPAPYRAVAVIGAPQLGLDTPLRTPQSLFVRDRDVYLCDTGNNRILQLRREGDDFTLVRVIDGFTGGEEPRTFSAPNDVYVTERGELYVADTNNGRVLKLDRDLNFLLAFEKPTDATFDQHLSFLPTKVVADVAGRAYVLARNINRGFVKFEADGEFAGFIGASEAKFSWYDYLWKLVSTKEQRALQESFVPTEYENMCLDSKGFIFAVTTVFSEYDLMSDVAKPIRRINAIGSDILIKNAHIPPIGDIWWGSAADVVGPSKLTDITVLDNGIYIALDRMRGKLFAYDSQGYMLWAMGGAGNMVGYFLRPASLEHMGYDLLVLDSLESTITVLSPTEYGRLMYQAGEEYLRGNYQASADYWREVLRLNANCEHAHVGIGRALLQQQQYKEAMDHFAIPRERKGYSDAFQLYRKEWVEQNIVWIFALVATVLIVPLAIGKFKRLKAEVKKA